MPLGTEYMLYLPTGQAGLKAQKLTIIHFSTNIMYLKGIDKL
ncbi:hypothetical protein [Aquiflexum sp.]